MDWRKFGWFKWLKVIKVYCLERKLRTWFFIIRLSVGRPVFMRLYN